MDDIILGEEVQNGHPQDVQQITQNRKITPKPQLMMSHLQVGLKTQSIQKKKQYLLALRENNQSLITKIKKLNDSVTADVHAIANRIVAKKKFTIPKFQEIQTKALKQKYAQMQKLRREIQQKRTGTQSLDFLINLKKSLQVRLGDLKQQLQVKKNQISKLQRIKDKNEQISIIQQNSLSRIGNLNIYAPQIEDLRKKVRQKSQTLKAKKQAYISEHKQSKSNRSIIVQPQPKIKQEEKDAQLLSIRKQYELTGKKVDALRSKKANLLKELEKEQDKKNLNKPKLNYLKAVGQDVVTKVQQ